MSGVLGSEPGSQSRDAGSDVAKPMARAALTGTLWMIVSSSSAKLLGLGSQLILAALLTEDQFGVYAIALSLSVLTTVLRDGGVRQLLIQRKDEYESLIGPVAWMALAFNLLAGLILAATGPIAAAVYGRSELIAMMALMGLGVLLTTPSAVLSARLLIDLRFRDLAWMAVASSALRYGASIGMAAAGFGAISFVMPIALVGILEWCWLRVLNPERIWRRPAEFGRWGSLLGQVRWILIGSLGTALVNMGNYSVVGLFVSNSIVGVYFFAYQIVIQIGVLISNNINQVLFPIFSGMTDIDRQRAAVDRVIRQLMLVAAPLGMGLIPTFPGIEAALWNGRWASAVHSVMIIAVFYPISVVIAVPYAALQARGDFRRWAMLLVTLGAAVMFAGAAGAAAGGTAEFIALFSGIALGVGSLVFTWLGLRHLGVTAGEVAKMTLPAWGLGLLAASAGLAVDWQLETLKSVVPPVLSSGRPAAAIRAGLAGIVFCTVYGLLARAILPDGIRDAVSMLPSRMRTPARRLLLLRAV